MNVHGLHQLPRTPLALVDPDQLQPGEWIKKGLLDKINGFIIGSRRDLLVVYFSSATYEITTTSVQEFCSDTPFVYYATRMEDIFTSTYHIGSFTATDYIEKCMATEEVEKNAQYYADHPERWKTYSQGIHSIENEQFGCYCTSKVKNETNRDKLKLGDHIFVIVKKDFLTTEHGIIIRYPRELRVVYFSDDLSRITVTSIEEFADGRPIGVADHASKPAEEVVALAMDFAQHPQKWINDYSLNPSLRFAEYCKKKGTQPIPYYKNCLKPGDHIFAKDENDFYRNHGIYLGGRDKQREVALFSKTNTFISLDEFLQNRKLCLCNNPLPSLTTSNVSMLPKDDSHERVGYFSHRISPSDLKPGDHIYVHRVLGAYQHHGIYVGVNDKGEHTVVHFTGTEGGLRAKSTATITKSLLKDFKGLSLIVRLVCYGADIKEMKRKISGTTQTLHSLPPQEVIATAQYYADRPGEWCQYNLVDNNCEMFAIYCKTGIKITGRSQIQGSKLGRAKYKYLPPV